MVFSRNVPIGEIKLFTLNIDNNLSTLTLAFDIREIPDTPPKKWESIGYNACRIGITCSEVTSLTTSNLPTREIFQLSIKNFESGHLVCIASETSEIKFITSSLRLREPSVYLTESPV
ncbi:Imm50 family immunity protein [Pseudomonas moraviensis]|uniref:Imm50 family immunity protein n=1 Tax=Pseudomonas moraviensis TaxID=321662 RepID=UPI003AF32EB8